MSNWNILYIDSAFYHYIYDDIIVLCIENIYFSSGMITSGFATFMPKFIQNQFGVSAGWAAMLTGMLRAYDDVISTRVTFLVRNNGLLLIDQIYPISILTRQDRS